MVSLYGQTVEQAKAALDGKVFTQTLPGEEDWLGPTLLEFVQESRKMIVEAPNITSAEFTYGPFSWMISGEVDAIELVLKGDPEMVIQIDSISDSQIYGRVPVDPADKRDPNEGKTEKRFDLFVMHNTIPNRAQLILGKWDVVVDKDAKKPPHFTTMEITANGRYRLYGTSVDKNGTWSISPSGRYFIISETNKEDLIFRIEDLTDNKLNMLQGHYYSAVLLNFEKK